MRQLILALILCAAAAVYGQTTAFTYQGRLTDASLPPTAQYDFIFRLFNSGGTQLGGDLARDDVQVTNGIFTVSLDFGSANFLNGAATTIEIAVRPGASTGAYTTLTPRQALTSSPYAIKSSKADDTASLGGIASSQYVQTSDSRLSDARTPTVGSQNYIQNTSTQQPGANFNIDGSGTVSGSLSANTVNSALGYNIGGSRILSFFLNNLFTGVGAGFANTSGDANSFFGQNAGLSNTTGGGNSFFGSNAGRSNATAFFNAFFGGGAGFSNTGSNNSFFGTNAGTVNTTGTRNSFFGTNAGDTNTTGNDNTIIGFQADVASQNLNFATAIGSGATVSTSDTITLGRSGGQDTVRVPGDLTVTGLLNVNLNAGSITSGTIDPVRLGIVPIEHGGTGSGSQNFVDLTTAQTIGGNKTFSGTLSGSTVNSSTQYNIAGARVLRANSCLDNTFLGIGAGEVNIGCALGGNHNSFFGANSGKANTGGVSSSADNNSFFGANSGDVNTTGFQNSFFGSDSGGSNTVGDNDSFFGFKAGEGNTTGVDNSFFGKEAGKSSGDSDANSFFGSQAGRDTTGTGIRNSFFGHVAGQINTSGFSNSFFGRSAGQGNLTGSRNVFVGDFAGDTNTDGDNNTVIGSTADVGSSNLDHATAIGAGSVVSTSNTVVIGRSTAQDTVRVPGQFVIGTLAAATATHLCINASDVVSQCSSSIRYKTNIGSFGSGLALVDRLRPVTFDWKETNEPDMGLIAEEVADVEPLLVTHNKTGQIEGVKYDRVSVVLINAVKEQQAQIERQQKQIDALKKLVCAQNSQAVICRENEK